jgi:hypothetical protein
VQLRTPHAGTPDLPPGARRVAVREWVMLDSLAPDTLLVIDVPAAPPTPREQHDAPVVVEA